MTTTATRTREYARRHAGLLALVLFVIGSVAAPMIDGWRHASDGTAAAQGSDLHDCVVCRLASTPTSLSDVQTAWVRERYEEDAPQFAPTQAPTPTPRTRLTPPTRAPPA